MFSKLTVGMVAVMALFSSAVCFTGTSSETSAAVTTGSPFHGTYAGGYWGTYTDTGLKVPYGGDVTATVSSTGAVKVTLPGAGTGTVTATGGFKVTGTLTVKGNSIPVTYTGTLTATTSTTKTAIVGSGTWSAPAAGASGKWLVQRTALTP